VSIVSILAQDPTPNVDPNYNPCSVGTYDAVANTCHHWPWYYTVIAIAFAAAIILGIWRPRFIANLLGIKSKKTSDSEGGIH
jgi:hypothetical protein